MDGLFSCLLEMAVLGYFLGYFWLQVGTRPQVFPCLTDKEIFSLSALFHARKLSPLQSSVGRHGILFFSTFVRHAGYGRFLVSMSLSLVLCHQSLCDS